MFRDHFLKDPFFQFPSIDMEFRNMESLMNMHHPAIGNSSNHNNRRSLAKRDDIGDLFGSFDSHFRGIQSMMNDAMGSFGHNMEMNDENGAFYSSSTVYSYTNDGSGNEPHVYQAHKSIRKGPGGIREEQKAERDSRKQEEKMAIGRYLGDRGKQTERIRNMRTNQQEENNDYYGIDESQSSQFDQEWENVARNSFIPSSSHGGGNSHHQIDNKQHRHNHHRSKKSNNTLEITDGSTKGRSKRKY